MPEIKVFIRYQDVFSESVDFNGFVNILKGFDRAFLLGVLIKIDTIFSKKSYRSFELQDFFISTIFNAFDLNILQQAISKLENRKRSVLVFSRQQIENLIRLAIVYCENRKPQDLDFADQNLGKLFLLMNDNYDSLIPPENDYEGTIDYLIRNYLYNSTPQMRKAIFRYYKLFVQLPKNFEFHSRDKFLNLFFVSKLDQSRG